MTQADQFITELTQEAEITRSVLERVPQEHLAWKPHPKSMALGQLAFHVATLPMGITGLLWDAVSEVPVVPLPVPESPAAILAEFEESITLAVERLSAWSDEDLAEMWRMTQDGQTLMERPRGAVLRTVMLNHWYHHRGQLAVYLRLLDVPVPPIYGPTADENPFAPPA